MGIYVPYINKPSHCKLCPVDWGELKARCKKDIKNCPLVEVEVPHGRLIDIGDALSQQIRITDLMLLPTVIEAEVE